MRTFARFAAPALTLVLSAGVPARAQDQPGGVTSAPEQSGLPVISQQQVEAIPEGGTLTLPAGRFRVPPGGLIVDRQIVIEGANPGTNRLTTGTILTPTDDAPVITIRTDIGNITLRNLIVDAEGRARNGIVLHTSVKVAYISLDNVSVWRAAGDGISIEAAPGGSAVNGLVLRECYSHHNAGCGIVLAHLMMPRIYGGFLSSNMGDGVRLVHCAAARVRDVSFESNGRGRGDGPPDAGFHNAGLAVAQLRLIGGHDHVVDGCVFENFAGPESGVAILVDGAQGTNVNACAFTNADSLGAATGVSYREGAHDNWLGTCTWNRVPDRWEMLQGSAVDVRKTQSVRN